MGTRASPEEDPLARTFVLLVSPIASATAKDFAQFAASSHCAETLAQHSLAVAPAPIRE